MSSGTDLECLWVVNSLPAAVELTHHRVPAVLVVDKAFGAQQIVEWMAQIRSAPSPAMFLVWGSPMNEAEALRFLQAGAKGITSKTADLNTLLACLRAVASGSCWMEDAVFRGVQRAARSSRSDLTPREQQVMELVEQGLKNREIAHDLGIRPGTVKIHLKHIFEKTGVRGRYGLALTGLKEKGLLNLPRM
jgi:two-component system, NarL family, nitrate/nitrite response regulator NarL